MVADVETEIRHARDIADAQVIRFVLQQNRRLKAGVELYEIKRYFGAPEKVIRLKMRKLERRRFVDYSLETGGYWTNAHGAAQIHETIKL